MVSSPTEPYPDSLTGADRLNELEKFRNLRLRVLAEQEAAITERIQTRPEPDEEEVSASAYREQIEPQCREAIFIIRRKGYRTASSGFASQEIDGVRYSGIAQTVDGGFWDLDASVRSMLNEHGYTTTGGSVGFMPAHADIDEITSTWNDLAELLPDLGHPADTNGDINEFYRMVRATTPWIDRSTDS